MQINVFRHCRPSGRRLGVLSAFFSGLALVVLSCFLTTTAHAQYRTSIQGVVADSTGAVIPGATLTLTNDGTGEKQIRTSDPSGVYNFNALPPDTFTLVVTKDGFQEKDLVKLQLIPEQANSINVQMVPGAAAQTVTVDASTQPALDTETANNGQSITAAQIQQMPVYQRDVTSLIQLAPGVLATGAQQGGGGGFQAPGTQTGASSGGGGNLGHSSSIFATENGASANANGGRFDSNGYSVDGISTSSAVWGGSTVVTPSEDSVGNVKIVTNAYDAENGRYSGALTEITSKTGTNDLHGSIFVEITRPGLNAWQRWNGPSSVQAFSPTGAKLTPQARGLLRDEDRYNQWGGSIGGPIWKNKIFAFFAYEGQSQTVPATSTQWFPTSQLTGLAPANSIASTYLNFKGANVLGTVIASVNCGDAGLIEGVNCVTIPGQGLNIGSPLTSALGTQDLTYVNNATPGVGSGLSNVADITQYSISNPTSSDFKQWSGRLDADVTSKDHASFAIYWVPASTTTYNGGLGYQLFNHSQINDAFSVIWNHTFSPTFLNEARANAAGWRYNELNTNPQAPFGLPQSGLFTANTAGTSGQIGSISLGQLGVPPPNHLDQWTYGYKDVATKVLNTQTMKFGFDFTRLYYLNDPIGTPTFTFYNLWDFLNDAPEAEGGNFQATTGLPGGYRNDNRQNLFGVFFQDDWKARPNLTLSAGLRYSYFGPLSDNNNNMGVLTFGGAADLLTNITIRTHIGAWNAQKLNFGPQVGFNWNPSWYNGRVVFRGGYGLNYNQEQIANSNNNDGNPPGTSAVPGSSTGPTNINPNILYAVSSSPTNIYGYPANPNTITTFNSVGLPVVGGANLGALTNNLPTAYTEHYSLDMQMDLTHQWVATLGYVGSSTHHLVYDYDANGYGTIYGAPLNPLVNSVNTFGSQGKGNNNMMLAGLKHQFSNTFSLETQYAWAHAMDTNSGPYFRDAYLYNTQYTYGRSDFDINQSFKLFGVWQPVIFRGSHDWKEKVFGGWTLSGIMGFHSGYGWTPVYAAPHQIYCNTCNYGFQNLRPYYLRDATAVSHSNNAFKTGNMFPNPGTADTGTNQDQFINNYFVMPNYANAIADNPGQVATAFIPAPGITRNSFPGPGYRDIDLNIAKSFGLPKMPLLGENANFEIKANMLNAFNFLNIDPSTLSTNIANSNLGQASSALGSRVITFQARFSF